jgi:uncharacterized repeat protein (TIGR01451 family)
MKKFTLMTLSCLLFCSIYSQCYPVFRNLDKQPPIFVNEPSREVYSFYYVHNGYNSNFDKKSPFMFSMWDGNAWQTIGNDSFKGSMPSLLQWGKRLLATGIFYEVNNIKAPAGKYFRFVEYMNGRWDTIPGCTFDSVSNNYMIGGAVASRDGLYYLMSDPSSTYSGFVYRYDTSLLRFTRICNYTGLTFQARLHAGDRRVMLSNVSKVNNIPANGFAYIDNDSLKINSDTSFTADHQYAIDGSNDHIYAMIGKKNSVVLEFGNSLVQRRNTFGNVIYYINAMAVHKGKLLSQSQDDAKNTYIHVLCPGGVSWATMLKHADGTNDYLTNPYACKTGIHLKYISSVSPSKTMVLADGAKLLGIAYIDNDTNCSHDSSELLLPGYMVRTGSKSYSGFAITDTNGRYEMFVYPDTIRVGGKGRLSACAGTSPVAAAQGSSYTKDLPIVKPTGFDIKVRFLDGHSVRWNSKVLYTAEIENLGMPFDSGHYEFTMDKRLRIDNKSLLGYINGNVGGGKFYNLGYFEERKISLLAWIDTGTTKPDSFLCHEVSAFLDTAEADSANNHDKICQRVVYSLDPNHKDCSKQTVLPGKSTTLDYYIGFQNEGNDDAYDVVLVDSLPQSLSVESFEIIGASHPYTVSLLGNVLKVTFSDIHLKPKKQNEELSQGYFKFSIRTNEGLEKGDVISNIAYIYFDLNKPVITNAAIVRVTDEESSVSHVARNRSTLLIYPNPGNGLLQLVGDANQAVQVYSMNGELVYSADSGKGMLEIDISSWAPGLYVVRCGSMTVTYMKTE